MKRRLLAMDWVDALFAHWPVDPDRVASALPAGVEPRTKEGDAWLGIVAFVMENVRPRWLPVGLSFGEVNLRTYVRGPDGGEGIYFFNLDAADPLGVTVARWLYDLPYYRAAMDVRRRGDEVHFTSHRTHPGVASAHFDASYRPVGARFEAEPGSLVAFLVENYCFYTAGDGLYRGDVAHDPWPLFEAELELRSTSLFAANGFDRPSGEPLAHYSPGVHVEADRIRPVD